MIRLEWLLLYTVLHRQSGKYFYKRVLNPVNIRRGVSAENMSVMRHLALNLIKKETQEAKFSVPRKRRKAGLYDEYREKVLGI